jgi:hypothetical protein
MEAPHHSFNLLYKNMFTTLQEAPQHSSNLFHSNRFTNLLEAPPHYSNLAHTSRFTHPAGGPSSFHQCGPHKWVYSPCRRRLSIPPMWSELKGLLIMLEKSHYSAMGPDEQVYSIFLHCFQCKHIYSPQKQVYSHCWRPLSIHTMWPTQAGLHTLLKFLRQ